MIVIYKLFYPFYMNEFSPLSNFKFVIEHMVFELASFFVTKNVWDNQLCM